MADKEKLQEEKKTGGPRMLRPGLGPQSRKVQQKENKKGIDTFIIIGDQKYKVENMAKGGRVGLKSGSKGCKLAMKGKGRAYGKNS